MTQPFQKFVVVALVLLGAMSSSGQVCSVGVYAGGVTYYPSRWAVGSPPFRFGLQEYSYSTDAAGYIIMVSTSRGTQPGDTFHRRTEILLGPRSFSVPLRPPVVAIIGGGLVLSVGLFLAGLKFTDYKQRRHETRVA